MPQIIKNGDRFKSGFFITNPARLTYHPYDRNNNFYLTQQDNTGIKEEMVKLITASEQVLKICSFILTDPEIYTIVLNKAQENKIAIFVLTQLDSSKLRNTSAIDPLMEEELTESSAEQHLHIIKTLYDNGVHVRAAYAAHAKFIIADRKKAFITSANLTTASLNKNTESGIYLGADDATALDQLFDVIFQKGTQYRHYITTSGNKNMIVQAQASLSQKEITHIGQSTGLRFTYEEYEHGLYRQIVALIESAKEFVYLSSYCLVELEALPELKVAITEAIGRKVKIKIFCRGMNFRNDHLTACDWMNTVGCEIYGDIYNHSKGIANETSGLIFTANIDGRHGLKKGFEVGCVLNELQRLAFISFHETVIASSDYHFQQAPLRRDFFDTYKSYELAKDIVAPVFPEHITIHSLQGDILNNTPLITDPIFYAEKSGESYLIAGNSMYVSVYAGGTFKLVRKEKQNYMLEKFILPYETLTVN